MPLLKSILSAFACCTALLIAPIVHASALETKIKNYEAIARGLKIAGVLPASDNSRVAQKTVKIAILDNGFQGFRSELGRTLPNSTVYHPGPIAPPQIEEAHGTAMAQIVTAILTDGGRSSRVPFELHLFNAFGYSNLASAVDEVVRGRFDVVLYAQVWEYGGNDDGGGFINSLITRAGRSGALWINAAGNFGKAMHRAQVLRTEDDWVALPGPNNSVRIRCNKSQAGKCRLRLVLSWNDFKDDVNSGSDKDLDLVLTDDTLKIVQTSGLTQKASFPDGQPGYSKYPREILQAEVTPGLYFARVKVRSKELFSSRDQLTLTSSGDFTEMLDNTPGETLLNPADNALVVTVGTSDSDLSSASRLRGKPEIVFPSLIRLDAGEAFKGSSNSSAIIAGVAALERAFDPRFSRDRLIEKFNRRRASEPVPVSQTVPAPKATTPLQEATGRGLPLAMLGFAPTGQGGCFESAEAPVAWPHLQAVLRDGGRAVRTTAGVKIIVPGDPLSGIRGLRRFQPNDMIVANHGGFSLHPRSAQGRIGHTFEVLELPLGTRFCSAR